MKKFLSLALVFLTAFSLYACGKSKAAEMVDTLILDIGTVTLNSESAILTAENAYGQLTDKDKQHVENLSLLMAARAEYSKLAEAEAERLAEEAAAAYREAGSKLISALKDVRSDCSFVNTCAGNVNGKGSRKFADSFTDRMQTAFNGVDLEPIQAVNPALYEEVVAIQADYATLRAYLIDMGNTNSDKNVPTMKALATSIITSIDIIYGNHDFT